MRKLSLFAAAGLIAMPLLSDANAADGDGRVYYDKGVNVQAGDARLRLNTQIQSRYSYEDYDNSEARGLDDRSNFRMRRVRLIASGDVMGGEFSYKLQNDFVGDSETSGTRDSDLKDAWIQWNGDGVNVRSGQFKVPYSAQVLAEDSGLQMIDRSIVVEGSDSLALEREAGLLIHGGCETLHWYGSVTNGESAGEGRNLPGVDSGLLGAALLTYSTNGYDRASEGDVKTTDGTAITAGLGATYGQAKDTGVGIDTTRVGADLGLRSGGLSASGEFHYRTTDIDGGTETDDIGYFAQVGYFVVPEVWELAGRFGAIDPDSDSSNPELTEYSVVLNHYLNGHGLKVQVGATWENSDPESGEDTTDARYEVQVGGYF